MHFIIGINSTGTFHFILFINSWVYWIWMWIIDGVIGFLIKMVSDRIKGLRADDDGNRIFVWNIMVTILSGRYLFSIFTGRFSWITQIRIFILINNVCFLRSEITRLFFETLCRCSSSIMVISCYPEFVISGDKNYHDKYVILIHWKSEYC